MKTILCLLAFSVFSSFADAAVESGPTEAAQIFYDAYMKLLTGNGDARHFILASKNVTPAFKKAYARLVKNGMDSDPIICGQDFPDAGFAASDAEIHGGKATVTMKSRGDTLKHSFRVTLRLVNGRWLISDTNDLKADADD